MPYPARRRRSASRSRSATGSRGRRRARPGLGGGLLVGDDFNADIYFNPRGAATTKDAKIGAYATDGGFQR